MTRRKQMTRFLVGGSWLSALAAFVIVAGHATGAVDACTSRQGFAPVPSPFRPLLAGSIALAVAAVPLGRGRWTIWLSFAGVLVTALVSLVVFRIGYGCDVG